MTLHPRQKEPGARKARSTLLRDNGLETGIRYQSQGGSQEGEALEPCRVKGSSEPVLAHPPRSVLKHAPCGAQEEHPAQLLSKPVVCCLGRDYYGLARSLRLAGPWTPSLVA